MMRTPRMLKKTWICLLVAALVLNLLSYMPGVQAADTRPAGAEAQTETAAPAEPAATEPPEPVVTTEPTEPVITTEPTEPVVTTEPTEPTEPEPTEPEPTEPEPTEPEPTEPEPTEPEPPEDAAHAPYIKGNNDGGFYPNSTLSRAELAAILHGLDSYAPGQDVFSDVRPKAWYAGAINALAAAGILSGYPDGTFRPTAPITRAELVSVLARISGETAQTDTSFTDVSAEFWARSAISLAQEKGWVTGYSDGTFRPKASITRAEAVVILNLFLGRTPDRAAIDSGAGLHFFPDVSPGRWYYYHVMEAATWHTAHWEHADSAEAWLDAEPGETALKDAFYCFGKRLYTVVNGSFVRTQTTGTLNGVCYTCQGSSGVCTAQTEVLALYDGNLIFLSGATPLAAPGGYQDGLYVKAGQLYAVESGLIVHSAVSGTLGGVPYTCTGATGVCTTPDWTVLSLPRVDLSCFSAHLTEEAQQTDSGTVSRANLVRAAVRVYETYFRVDYPITNGTYSEYIRKAAEYGILDSTDGNFSTAATRRETVRCLWRALHGRELECVNDVQYIPDVAENDPDYAIVTALYRAGVMGGVDEARSAALSGSVSRSELAGLLTRLERRDQRLRFTLKPKQIETFNYGWSGSGKYPLTATRIGDGKNVMLLTFAIHGWEDNFDRDGEELIYLADCVKDWLDENYDLVRAGNWTVYVLRCLNPDGVYLGTTCNGKGRCTTTRLSSAGTLLTDKGIDMNRCFPYKYQSYTDARNFNGTAPLQCKEAQALASFVQRIKGSGYNICVDTHGWYGQVICSSGRGDLAEAFLNAFPNNTYTYLSKGYGYFTGWTGFIQGFDSCLLELPRTVYSHADFLDAGCVWRYENALKKLLTAYDGVNAVRGEYEYGLIPETLCGD